MFHVSVHACTNLVLGILELRREHKDAGDILGEAGLVVVLSLEFRERRVPQQVEAGKEGVGHHIHQELLLSQMKYSFSMKTQQGVWEKTPALLQEKSDGVWGSATLTRSVCIRCE